MYYDVDDLRHADHLEHTLNNLTTRNKLGAGQAFILDNHLVAGERNLDPEVQKLKEVLKGFTKVEPWLDIPWISLFPNARFPPGFKLPHIEKFNDISRSTKFLNCL